MLEAIHVIAHLAKLLRDLVPVRHHLVKLLLQIDGSHSVAPENRTPSEVRPRFIDTGTHT